MQPTNSNRPKTSKPTLLSKKTSRCVYCGSSNRGKGCRYGPHGVHFHPDDPTKCAYCGSTNYGRGCHVNPTSNIHVHGINYNAMFKESIQGFLDTKVLVHELQKKYTDFKAYELGLIDDQGNKIREPITEEEKTAFTSSIRCIIKLKKYLGPKADLLDATSYFAMEPIKEDFSRTLKKTEHKDKIDKNINNLYKLMEEAHADGLTLEEILSMIKA